MQQLEVETTASFGSAPRPTQSAPAAPPDKDDRRIQRISLPLPVRVEVLIDGSNGWNEVTRLSDVSAYGCGFTLKRPIKRGRLVLLTVPMPRQLRSFDYSEPQYRVWALVRRCIAKSGGVGDQEFSIGVAFTGKRPPEGHFDQPSRLYDIDHQGGTGLWHVDLADLRKDESDMPKELRKQTRYFIPEALKLEQVDAAGNVTFSEASVTENLSYGGASVFSTLTGGPGTFLRVTSERFDVTILSVVRGTRVGPDGIPRLHIEFIDRFFPLEGIVSE
jgi:hypothetical protein